MLSIRGELVIQLRFGFAITIATESTDVKIGSDFRLVGPDAHVHTIDPETPTHADELTALHQTTVDGDCFSDGRLQLRFSNGFTVEAGPGDQYEAWELWRSNGEIAVAVPGGGLTTWGPRA